MHHLLTQDNLNLEEFLKKDQLQTSPMIITYNDKTYDLREPDHVLTLQRIYKRENDKINKIEKKTKRNIKKVRSDNSLISKLFCGSETKEEKTHELKLE